MLVRCNSFVGQLRHSICTKFVISLTILWNQSFRAKYPFRQLYDHIFKSVWGVYPRVVDAVKRRSEIRVFNITIRSNANLRKAAPIWREIIAFLPSKPQLDVEMS